MIRWLFIALLIALSLLGLTVAALVQCGPDKAAGEGNRLPWCPASTPRPTSATTGRAVAAETRGLVETGAAAPTGEPPPTETREVAQTPVHTHNEIPISTTTPSLPLTATAATTAAPIQSNLLWHSGFEGGNFDEWANDPDGQPDGGGVYNNGDARNTISSTYAHSGSLSARLEITTTYPTGKHAVRIFRWHEARQYNELYYSVWFYFPQQYTSPDWWNIFQWKSKHGGVSDTNPPDPTQDLTINNRPTGEMYLTLWDTIQNRIHNPVAQMNIPVGRWWHLEAYMLKTTNKTGRIRVWQDGVLIFDEEGIQTAYSGDLQWSVDNYSANLRPRHSVIYIDDAAISTTRVGEDAP